MKKIMYKYLFVSITMAFLAAIYAKYELPDIPYSFIVIALTTLFFIIGIIVTIWLFIYYWISDGFRETWDLFTNPRYDD